MKTVNTLEEAYQIIGYNREEKIIFPSYLSDQEKEAHQALFDLTTVFAATNKINNWEANWNDPSQRKYYPWVWVDADDENPSGSGLSFDGCAGDDSFSGVGSRLCTFSSDSARHIFETFKELYTKFFIIKK
jgi:hypothetical protein